MFWQFYWQQLLLSFGLWYVIRKMEKVVGVQVAVRAVQEAAIPPTSKIGGGQGFYECRDYWWA